MALKKGDLERERRRDMRKSGVRDRQAVWLALETATRRNRHSVTGTAFSPLISRGKV